jgi:glycosyltransferase involved in cell wall biosynthesis
MENCVKVSVYCLAYNHSAFIEQTIKGFLSQKTNFRFEVIIHDDASPDGTANIIKKYEKEYPDIIKGIYQVENQYSKCASLIQAYILPRLSGEYVAICEGDDFWTDPNKLQRQVDALDANPDCHFCVHKTNEVWVSGEETGKTFPSFDMDSKIMDSCEFLTLCSKSYSFHTSSYMFRMTEWRKYMENPPKFKSLCDVGDEPYLLYFGQLGKVCYMNQVMSAYRRGVPSSWSQSNAVTTDINRLIKHPTAMIATYEAFDEYTGGKYHSLFVHKLAMMKLRVAVYTRNCKQLLSKKEKEYFQALSISKRGVVVVAAIFPRTVLKYYIRRLNRLNRRKGYV